MEYANYANLPEASYDEDLAKIVQSDEYLAKIQSEIQVAQAKVEDIAEIDTSDFESQIRTLTVERDELVTKIGAQSRIDDVNERISELEKDEKRLGKELAGFEKKEFTVDKFIKAQTEAMQKRINGMFTLVTFQTTKQLINGGEEPTCETLVNGVPYPDVNHAGKINAGIDIINAISLFYNKKAPIFVDNAEAVNTLQSTECQLIELIVNDQKLKVNHV
jgi:hypothetical protein